jgi:hypothetical protein
MKTISNLNYSSKGIKFVTGVIFISIFCSLFNSCVSLNSTDFTKKFMDTSLSIEDHSVLFTMPYIDLGSLDNRLVKPLGMLFKSDIDHYYLIPPGEHELEYRYIDPATKKETGFLTKKLNFVAGKYYVVVGITEKSAANVFIDVIELTDQSHIEEINMKIREKLK